MGGKWRRYAIIGVLLFDLCLLAVRAESMFDQGQHAAPWAQGLNLQKAQQEDSFGSCSTKTQTAEKLTMTTVFLLTAMALM
jgi:hypothetical protein